MTIAMFAISLTISKRFAVNMYVIFNIPLEWVKVKCKYANRKHIHNLLFCNSNFYPVCRHFHEIDRRNMHDLDLDFQKASVKNAH